MHQCVMHQAIRSMHLIVCIMRHEQCTTPHAFNIPYYATLITHHDMYPHMRQSSIITAHAAHPTHHPSCKHLTHAYIIQLTLENMQLAFRFMQYVSCVLYHISSIHHAYLMYMPCMYLTTCVAHMACVHIPFPPVLLYFPPVILLPSCHLPYVFHHLPCLPIIVIYLCRLLSPPVIFHLLPSPSLPVSHLPKPP